MAIKFHTEEEVKEKQQLTLDDVEHDQFFIDIYGRLCQKTYDDSYTVIANSSKSPYSFQYNGCEYDMVIKEILPEVTKITWG